jgi:para-nitrobenzyl esterase
VIVRLSDPHTPASLRQLGNQIVVDFPGAEVASNLARRYDAGDFATPVTGFDARAAELDRIWFTAIRDDALNALRSQQAAVWAYEFEWDELPAPFDTIFGAAHTFDLPFVFGNFGPSLYSRISFTRANERGRRALSRVMQNALGAFARSGDPNHGALGMAWGVWPSKLRFDADAAAARLALQ